MSSDIPLYMVLSLAAILFFTGVYGLLVRRNLIAILISAELMLNSININFVAFNRYLFPQKLEGMFFSFFLIVVILAETAVAAAIIVSLFRKYGETEVNSCSRQIRNQK